MGTTVRLPDIEAEIYFLTPEEGGRTTPFFSGYRPQICYDGFYSDARQDYEGSDEVLPGQKVKTFLTFSRPDYQLGKIHAGKEFLVYEGPKLLGRGKVTMILNLENAAEESVKQETKRYR